MKRCGYLLCVAAAVVFLAAILLGGCGGRSAVIPPAPQFRQFEAMQLPGGVCFDNDNADILADNVEALKKYADELRRLLEETAGR